MSDEPTEASGGAAASKPAPGLYVVATPIGNLRDITLRALDLLRAADCVACEDTRITSRLLQRYCIARPLIPYHDHNAQRMRPRLLARLTAGAVIALVTDAGTPLISDPGYRLVRAAQEAGVAVRTVPGASALTAALAVAGVATDRFLFVGFLPAKPVARRRALRALAAIEATLVFFETAPRLGASLAAMAAALGEREAAVARELTKRFEEVLRDRLAALAARYAAAGAPKGEIVVIVGPPEAAAPKDLAEHEVEALLRAALARLPPAAAATEVAGETGQPRRELYARAIALRGAR